MKHSLKKMGGLAKMENGDAKNNNIYTFCTQIFAILSSIHFSLIFVFWWGLFCANKCDLTHTQKKKQKQKVKRRRTHHQF